MCITSNVIELGCGEAGFYNIRCYRKMGKRLAMNYELTYGNANGRRFKNDIEITSRHVDQWRT